MQLPLAPWRAARIRHQSTQRAGTLGLLGGGSATPASSSPQAESMAAGSAEGEVIVAAAAWPEPRQSFNRGAP